MIDVKLAKIHTEPFQKLLDSFSTWRHSVVLIEDFQNSLPPECREGTHDHWNLWKKAHIDRMVGERSTKTPNRYYRAVTIPQESSQLCQICTKRRATDCPYREANRDLSRR